MRGATGIIAPLLKLVRLQQPNARTVDVERAAVACHHAGLVKKPVKALSMSNTRGGDSWRVSRKVRLVRRSAEGAAGPRLAFRVGKD